VTLLERGPSRRFLLLHLLPLLASIGIGVGFAIAKGQDLNFDLLNYHFYDPWAFLHGRSFSNLDFAPAQMQTFFNPLVDVPAYLLMTHTSPMAVGAILGAWQGLNLWLIYEIGLVAIPHVFQGRLLVPLTAFFVAALSFFGANNSAEIGGTMDDNTTSVLVLAALWLLLRRWDATSRPGISARELSPRRRARVVASRCAPFALVGLAVALKPTNAPFAVALLAVDVIETLCGASARIGSRALAAIRSAGLRLVALAAGFCVAASYWAWQLWVHYQNPFFPLFNNVFHSSYVLPVSAVDARFFPRNLGQWLFYPFYFLRVQNLPDEVDFRDARLAAIYAMAVLVLAYAVVRRLWRGRWQGPPQSLRILLIFAAVSYLLWETVYSVYRYTISLEFLALLIVTLSLGYIVTRRAAIVVAAVCVSVAIALSTVPCDFGRLPWQGSSFGVQVPDASLTAPATVLMIGTDPDGFLVPYLPSETDVIRVQSGLTEIMSPKFTKLMNNLVVVQRSSGRNFYVLMSVADAASAPDVVGQFGFSVGSCKPVVTFAQPWPGYYETCILTEGH